MTVERPYERHAFVCTSGSWCPVEGPAVEVHKRMKEVVREAAASAACRVNKSGCLDQCGRGPVVVVYPEGVWYAGVDVEKAERIAREHLLGGVPVEELRWRPERPGSNKTDRVREAEAAKKKG